MDNKLELYQQSIISVLEEYAQVASQIEEIESQVIADTKNNHYLVMQLGWLESHFSHDCMIHLDIKDEKIWLQCNWTDRSIAEELIEKGVERNDIVLGFIPADQRQYTDYAAYPEVQTEETTS
jgi:hypothetical protein